MIPVMVVLGNKCDLGADRKVPLQQAQEYAASIGAAHFETSAMTNEGEVAWWCPSNVYFRQILLFMCGLKYIPVIPIF